MPTTTPTPAAAAVLPPRPDVPSETVACNLVRYGVQWTGPKTPICVLANDGYWTPWHIAQETVDILVARIEQYQQELDALRAERASNREREAFRAGFDAHPSPTGMIAMKADPVASISGAAGTWPNTAEGWAFTPDSSASDLEPKAYAAWKSQNPS